MCRLAIYGNIKNFNVLARGLDQLEKSMGGDGNGYYFFGMKEVDKGLDLTTGEIAFDTFAHQGAVMYHTRFATAGGARDDLNHPFEGEKYVVMHNGHWSGWQWYGDGQESDTETAAYLVEKHGPGVLMNSEFDHSGVWCVLDKATRNTLVIPRGSTSFVFQFLKGGGFFHASERIKNIDAKRVQTVKRDKQYMVMEDGLVVELTLDPVPMPEENWENYRTLQAKEDRRWGRTIHGNYKNYSGISARSQMGEEIIDPEDTGEYPRPTTDRSIEAENRKWLADRGVAQDIFCPKTGEHLGKFDDLPYGIQVEVAYDPYTDGFYDKTTGELVYEGYEFDDSSEVIPEDDTFSAEEFDRAHMSMEEDEDDLDGIVTKQDTSLEALRKLDIETLYVLQFNLQVAIDKDNTTREMGIAERAFVEARIDKIGDVIAEKDNPLGIEPTPFDAE